jgi:hypothetical protein
MRKRLNALVQFIVVAVAGAALTTAPAQETRNVLREVEERVRPVLAGLNPAATVEYPEYV